MTSLKTSALLLTIVSIVVLAGEALAQTSRATIRGIVVDQTGARLPGVDIKVLREETNETRQGVSEPQGHFAFPELAAGSYTIEATLKGFTVFRNRAELTVGQELWLEPELTVTTTAAVTTGGAESRVPLLERNSPAMSTLIDRDQVANLPLDGRNFLELALLAPGHRAGAAGLGELGPRRFRVQHATAAARTSTTTSSTASTTSTRS